MKFRYYLEQITGVGIYPMVSLLLFFALFAGLTIWALKADKKLIKSLKNLPFPDQQ
jgi:cytochrome c oxidase cbb3-type subunit 3